MSRRRFATLLSGGVIAFLAAFHAPTSPAFVGAVHWDLTGTALTDVSVSRTVAGKTLTFSDYAIFEIRTANLVEDVDNFTVASHHFDNERLVDGSTRLTTLKQLIASALSSSPPDGFTARRRLGGALHSIQDWYSHTNWVELGSNGIQSSLGRSVVANPSPTLVTCNADMHTLVAGLTEVTSGYYPLPDPCAAAPTGKCLHGAAGCEGVNKDSSARPGFQSAHDLALAASIDYVNQVLDSPGVSGNAKAIRALMGQSFPFGFVIDDSASTTPSLASLKQTIHNVVSGSQALLGGGGDMLLTTFGPGISPVRRTVDRDELVSWIDALAPQGPAGDGDEPSMAALLRTVSVARTGTTLFLVTDAKCADPQLAPAVAGLIRARGVQVVAVLTGPDSQGDPCYRTVAEDSGGVALHVAADNAGAGVDMLRAIVTGETAQVVAVEGTLSGPKTVTFPMECGVSQLVMTATVATSASVRLTRPAGVEVVDPDEDASVVALSNGAVVQVGSPANGTWTARLDGSGHYSLRVWAVGAVAVRDVSFVSRTTSEHAPLIPESGLPSPGASTLLTALVTGPASQESFALVDEGGTTLSSPTLARQDPDAGADRFVGTVVPPASVFRLVVSGKDGTNCDFRRTFPALFGTSDVRLSAGPSVLSAGFPAGTTTTLTATLTNGGGAGTFDVFAQDDAGRVTRVEPTSLVLGAGASGTFSVDVTVSADEKRGSIVSLTLAAVEHGGTRANTLTRSAPVTDGTLAMTLRKLVNHDRSKAGRDSISTAGALTFDAESPDATIVPATDATRIEVGDSADPFVFDIPAGDSGWKASKKGVLTWRSPRGTAPVVVLVVDPRRRKFSLAMSRFDFPSAPGRSVRVTLRIGDDVGSTLRTR